MSEHGPTLEIADYFCSGKQQLGDRDAALAGDVSARNLQESQRLWDARL